MGSGKKFTQNVGKRVKTRVHVRFHARAAVIFTRLKEKGR